jgi:hypothetical protein
MENFRFSALSDSPYTKPDLKINPKLSGFAQYYESINPKEKKAVEEYMAIAGAYNNLWLEIYKRTTTKSWERDSRGLGSCGVSNECAKTGFEDTLVPNHLIRLRELRNNEIPKDGKNEGCPCHRPGVGCVVADLKGPLCLDYVDLYMKPEIEARFGICLMPIKPYLVRAGRSGDGFADKTVTAINKVKDYITEFPILTSFFIGVNK